MRQIHMQKTLRNALLFCKFSIYILHMNFAQFSVFFAGKFAENCVAIFYIFKFFRDDFYETVCRDGKGGIPV